MANGITCKFKTNLRYITNVSPTSTVHGNMVGRLLTGDSAYHELTFTSLLESLNCRFAQHGIQ